MSRSVDVAVTLATTPALSLWTRREDGTVSLTYDGADHDHTFKGGGLILEARPPALVEGNERRGARIKLVLTGDVDTALQGDIGSPSCWIWWLSGGTQGAPRVDDYYEGVVDSLVRTPQHEAILTVTNPLAYVRTLGVRRWSHANQINRYSDDNSMQYLAGTSTGLKPIQSGKPKGDD